MQLMPNIRSAPCISALLSVLLMLVMSVPGELMSRTTGIGFGQGRVTIDRYEHGWPRTYLFRVVNSRSPHQDENASLLPWLRYSGWSVGGEVEFRRNALLYDVVVIVLIANVVYFAFKWRGNARQRWHHFTLSEMLLTITVVSIAIGWLHVTVAQCAKEQAVARTFSNSSDWHVRLRYTGPTWLSRLVGSRTCLIFYGIDEMWIGRDAIPVSVEKLLRTLEHLRIVHIDGTSPQVDMALQCLTERSSLDEIHLTDMTLTTDSNAAIERMPAVRVLWWNSGDITLEFIGALSRMRQLRELYVDGYCNIDEASEHFVQLSRLRKLGVWSSNLTEIGVSNICGLATLESLGLDCSNISAAELTALTRLERLEDLHLINVNDATVEGVRVLRTVRKLEIDSARVTDKSIDSFCDMQGLTQLVLVRCRVTDMAQRTLERKRPLLQIERI